MHTLTSHLCLSIIICHECPTAWLLFVSLHNFSCRGREDARGGVCFYLHPLVPGMAISRASRHCCIISCQGQQGVCTGALDQELTDKYFALLGWWLSMSQASCPGSLKGQVKSRIEGNSLDFTLIILCDALKAAGLGITFGSLTVSMERGVSATWCKPWRACIAGRCSLPARSSSGLLL